MKNRQCSRSISLKLNIHKLVARLLFRILKCRLKSILLFLSRKDGGAVGWYRRHIYGPPAVLRLVKYRNIAHEQFCNCSLIVRMSSADFVAIHMDEGNEKSVIKSNSPSYDKLE